MTNQIDYSREEDLKSKLNHFLKDITGTDKDFYSQLSLSKINEMKSALRNINNVVTYRVTLLFVDWLREKQIIANDIYLNTLESVKKTKPNSNGYDVHINSGIKLIAEVKCNNPINEGHKYGVQQAYTINEDIKKLLNGKGKLKSLVDNFYKFLVIYDTNGNASKAIIHLVSLLPDEVRVRTRFYSPNIILDTDNVFIVVIVENPENSILYR